MGRRVDRVILDRGSDVESRLLEAERQAPGTGEEVDADRAISASRIHFLFCFFGYGQYGRKTQTPHIGLRGRHTLRPCATALTWNP